MKEKTRKLSIQMKILIPATILIVLICAVLGFTAYRSINKGMVAMGVEAAEVAATIAENVVDGDLVEQLEPGCEDTEGYQTLLKAMRNVQENYGIAYLYTLYKDGTNLYYGVDTDDSALQAEVGDECDETYDMLASVFAGEEYVMDYIDYTEYGNLISVYFPIENSAGKVVGVLGCDYDANNVVERLNTTIYQVIVMAVICLVIAVILLITIIRGITKSLRTVDNKIYDLVHNEGDLTQKLDIHTGDEMELIAGNVNKLLEYIREIMLNIADNSANLIQSSQKMVGSLSDADVSITDVSATMEEMSAAMEETSASLNQVNESISHVYDAVNLISESANEGKQSSDSIMSKAQEVRNKAAEEQQNAKKQVKQMEAVLNEKIEKSRAVEEINTLTSNIISITEQTNLLALNASIEAARAGDAGRGFAVVADEISKLASSSSESATQIRKVSAEVIQAVNELAEKAGDMLKFMDKFAMEGYEKLLDTSENYREAAVNMNQMMNDFAEKSADIKESIDHIKEATAAVGIAVEESTNGVTNVTETSISLTTNVGEIKHEADSNKNIADMLNDEVNKFKLQ